MYRPERSSDFKFIDRQVSEMFQIGGTDVFLHKYIGPKLPETSSPSTPINDNAIPELGIQDLLFLENRDRKYAPDVYHLRGIYNVQDLDFNLSQFGLFIDNDTVFMTVHINDFIKYIGRKPMSGDVIELPHLTDQFALNDSATLPKFFVISDVGRASEGFSVTWYPHLYRLKLTKISDSQEYKDILIRPTDPNVNFMNDYDPAVTYKTGDVIRYQGNLYSATATVSGVAPPNAGYYVLYQGASLQDVLSTSSKNLEINDAVVAQAELNAPASGYETRQFYTLAVDPNTGATSIDPTSAPGAAVIAQPVRNGYCGYLVGDGIPPNGASFSHGIAFPATSETGEYYLRTDYLPNRLFRYDGIRWVKIEDAVRHTLTNTDSVMPRTIPRGEYSNTASYAVNDLITFGGLEYIATKISTGKLPTTSQQFWKEVRLNQKGSFINNTTVSNIGGEMVAERQALSSVLKPRADF